MNNMTLQQAMLAQAIQDALFAKREEERTEAKAWLVSAWDIVLPTSQPQISRKDFRQVVQHIYAVKPQLYPKKQGTVITRLKLKRDKVAS